MTALAILMPVFFAGCSGNANSAKPPSTPGTNARSLTPAPTAAKANTNSAEDVVAASEPGLSTANICTMPRSAASAGSGLAMLGGGTWGKWDEQGGDLGFSCTGGLDSVKLEDVVAKISAYYTPLGDANAVHRVSVKYVALQYGGKAPVEKDLRQQYVKFCDSLSQRFYGKAFSEKFAKALSDETAYSTTDKPSESFDAPGGGYVTLTSSSTKEGMMTLETTFYASEAEYKKYKDL